jgi:beta-ribofuranosylaminobenzene 5'-phosphate synthase
MADTPESITVFAPARLHLGFIDLTGGPGRRFGSLGLALDDIGTRVHARAARSFSVSGEDAPRAQRHLAKLRRQLKLQQAVALTIEQTLQPHSGLGSGTQLALAVGTAAAKLNALEISPRRIADLLDRGNRSGIGLGAFEYGGFLVDGGRGALPGAPPLISRLHFPDEWRVILLFDPNAQGLHGTNEARAFRELAPFPQEQAGELAHAVLLRALPAIAEKDLATFGAAINLIQQVIGDYFASAQGGRYISARVGEALTWMQGEGVQCAGQTSWGPTGFAIVASEEQAKELLKSAARRLRGAGLEHKLCRVRNSGASVEVRVAQAPKQDAA